MPGTDFDAEHYAGLLARVRPAVIETPEEHDRLLTIAEELMDKGAALEPEERKLLELIVLLIRVFEEQVEQDADDDDGQAEPPPPHETLRRLMESRHWEPSMLNDIFGNPRLVHLVLSGERPISNGQAKALGKLFSVPYKLFLNTPPR